MNILPTQDRLRDIFRYDEGLLIRTKHINSNAKIGMVVGCPNGTGYMRVTVDKKSYLLHRLIWVYHYGDIPTGLLIDHKDTNRNNNRITNLRLITKQDNHFNRSDVKGFYWEDRRKHFVSRIKVSGKQIYIGSHKTGLEARQAYLLAKKKYHVIDEFICMD